MEPSSCILCGHVLAEHDEDKDEEEQWIHKHTPRVHFSCDEIASLIPHWNSERLDDDICQDVVQQLPRIRSSTDPYQVDGDLVAFVMAACLQSLNLFSSELRAHILSLIPDVEHLELQPFEWYIWEHRLKKPFRKQPSNFKVVLDNAAFISTLTSADAPQSVKLGDYFYENSPQYMSCKMMVSRKSEEPRIRYSGNVKLSLGVHYVFLYFRGIGQVRYLTGIRVVGVGSYVLGWQTTEVKVLTVTPGMGLRLIFNQVGIYDVDLFHNPQADLSMVLDKGEGVLLWPNSISTLCASFDSWKCTGLGFSNSKSDTVRPWTSRHLRLECDFRPVPVIDCHPNDPVLANWCLRTFPVGICYINAAVYPHNFNILMLEFITNDGKRYSIGERRGGCVKLSIRLMEHEEVTEVGISRSVHGMIALRFSTNHDRVMTFGEVEEAEWHAFDTRVGLWGSWKFHEAGFSIFGNFGGKPAMIQAPDYIVGSDATKWRCYRYRLGESLLLAEASLSRVKHVVSYSHGTGSTDYVCGIQLTDNDGVHTVLGEMGVSKGKCHFGDSEISGLSVYYAKDEDGFRVEGLGFEFGEHREVIGSSVQLRVAHFSQPSTLFWVVGNMFSFVCANKVPWVE